MKKINRPRTSKLSVDSYVQMMNEFKDLIIRTGAANLKIEQYFDGPFMNLYSILQEAYKKNRKSAFTELLNEADAARDDIFYSICDIINAYCRHPKRETMEAAKRLKTLLSPYGNIAKKTLDGQTGATKDLVAELQGKYASDITLIKMDEWINYFKQTNDEFDTLMKKRFKEKTEQSDITMSEIRKELDNYLRKLCNMIELLADMEKSEVYASFIKELNIIFARYSSKRASDVSASYAIDSPVIEPAEINPSPEPPEPI